MAGREPSEAEVVAADVVAEHVGGCWRSRDGLRAAEGMHDFDINLPDGRRIAVEVTSIADPEVVGFNEVLFGSDWVAPQLESDWWVALPSPDAERRAFNVKRRKSAITDALVELERLGVTELGRELLEPCAQPPEAMSEPVRDVIATLVSVGVTSVRSTRRRLDDPARLIFSTHGGAVGNSDQLNALVAGQVERKYQKPARQADAFQRHLFLWLTDTYPDAERAFSTLSPPPAPPIPPDLEVVWLARYAWPVRLWRLRPPDGWEPLEEIHTPQDLPDHEYDP